MSQSSRVPASDTRLRTGFTRQEETAAHLGLNRFHAPERNSSPSRLETVMINGIDRHDVLDSIPYLLHRIGARAYFGVGKSVIRHAAGFDEIVFRLARSHQQGKRYPVRRALPRQAAHSLHTDKSGFHPLWLISHLFIHSTLKSAVGGQLIGFHAKSPIMLFD